MTARGRTVSERERRATAVLSEGLRVLGRAIRDEPRVFAVAFTGSVAFGLLTIATAFVIGEVVGRIVVPAFDTGRVVPGDPRAGRGGDRGPVRLEGVRHLRPPARRRRDAVPAPGRVPPAGDPALPGPPAVLASPQRDRHPAVQRQLGRRGAVVSDRADAVRGRHGRHAGRRDGGSVRHRLDVRAGRSHHLSGAVRSQRHLLPAHVAAHRARAGDAGARPARSRTRASTVPWSSRRWAANRRRRTASRPVPATCATR